jgi:hypothetical protein
VFGLFSLISTPVVAGECIDYEAFVHVLGETTDLFSADFDPADGPEGSLQALHANPIRAANGMTFDVHGSGPFVLEIFDTTGQRIRRLADPSSRSGVRSIAWDLRDEHGHAVAPGVYFYRFAGNGGS